MPSLRKLFGMVNIHATNIKEDKTKPRIRSRFDRMKKHSEVIESGNSPIASCGNEPALPDVIPSTINCDHQMLCNCMDEKNERGSDDVKHCRRRGSADACSPRTNLSKMQSVKPFNSSNEYLFAMREDLADWFSQMYCVKVNQDNFFNTLGNGVLLCKHANQVMLAIRKKITKRIGPFMPTQSASRHEQPSETDGSELNVSIDDCCSANQHFVGSVLVDVTFRKDAKPESFAARDNVTNFINWARHCANVRECLMFETDDLILLKNERNVILCLLEVARFGAAYDMLIPKLVRFEQDIAFEIEMEQQKEFLSLSALKRKVEDQQRMRTQASGGALLSSPPAWIEKAKNTILNRVVAQGESNRKETLKILRNELNDKACSYDSSSSGDRASIEDSDLLLEVQQLVDRCVCKDKLNLLILGPGKYRFGDSRKTVFVRRLNDHLMVNTEINQWDTLGNYLSQLDPCRRCLSTPSSQNEKDAVAGYCSSLDSVSNEERVSFQSDDTVQSKKLLNKEGGHYYSAEESAQYKEDKQLLSDVDSLNDSTENLPVHEVVEGNHLDTSFQRDSPSTEPKNEHVSSTPEQFDAIDNELYEDLATNRLENVGIVDCKTNALHTSLASSFDDCDSLNESVDPYEDDDDSQHNLPHADGNLQFQHGDGENDTNQFELGPMENGVESKSKSDFGYNNEFVNTSFNPSGYDLDSLNDENAEVVYATSQISHQSITTPNKMLNKHSLTPSKIPVLTMKDISGRPVPRRLNLYSNNKPKGCNRRSRSQQSNKINYFRSPTSSIASNLSAKPVDHRKSESRPGEGKVQLFATADDKLLSAQKRKPFKYVMNGRSATDTIIKDNNYQTENQFRNSLNNSAPDHTTVNGNSGGGLVTTTNARSIKHCYGDGTPFRENRAYQWRRRALMFRKFLQDTPKDERSVFTNQYINTHFHYPDLRGSEMIYGPDQVSGNMSVPLDELPHDQLSTVTSSTEGGGSDRNRSQPTATVIVQKGKRSFTASEID